MALKPHIIHIVGHTEADHAATALDVIDASLAARRSIENALAGQPDMTVDSNIQARKRHLIDQVQITLQAIRNLAGESLEDPLTHPATLTRAVNLGILDAPQLKNNPFAPGAIRTRVLEGACEAVKENGEIIGERERLQDYF